MSGGLFLVLLTLKLRLMGRSFSSGGLRGMLLFFGLGLAFFPLWGPAMGGIYATALHVGEPMIVTTLGLLHLGWISASLLLGAFAEGLDLRLLLRYPVPPRTVFTVNVLVAPVEFTAFFLVPPVVAVVAAAATRAGPLAAAMVTLVALVVLYSSAAIAQALLALLGRFLARDGTRAVVGVLVGLLFAAPAFFYRGNLRAGGLEDLWQSIAALLAPAARVLAYFPTLAFPARAVRAALGGDPVVALAWVLAALVLFVLLLRAAAHLALAEALNRTAPATSAAPRGGRLDAALARILPADLAALVAAQIRVYARTPQILGGVLLSPVLVVILTQHRDFGATSAPFFVTMAALITALNLSSNQFGLDHAGVRLLFLAPLPARRIVLAKNLSVIALAAICALLCVATALVTVPAIDALAAAASLATQLAALPVLLIFGTRLSVRNPWRMTFKLGGAPPGVMMSAFAQMLAVGLVCLALAPALIVLPALYGPGLAVRFASLGITLALGAVLWTAFYFYLSRAARNLEAARELLIDRLAKPGDTG